jgi:hypothetical protein
MTAIDVKEAGASREVSHMPGSTVKQKYMWIATPPRN